MKVFGGMFAWLLRGHSSLCTDQRATGIYRTIHPQGFKNSMLATARVLCFPPTTPHSLPAPSLSSRDLPVPTISSDKGSDTSPTPPPVETRKKLDRWNRLLGWFWFFYISILITISLSHIGYFLNVFVRLWKIGWINMVQHSRSGRRKAGMKREVRMAAVIQLTVEVQSFHS